LSLQSRRPRNAAGVRSGYARRRKTFQKYGKRPM